MANDFKEAFDMSKLDEQQLGMVEFVLNSPAYMDTFKPYLITVRDNLNTLWLDRSQMRKDQMSDDYLAGGIAMIDGLLKFFAVVIHETSMERIHASMSNMTPEREYDQHAQAGLTKPVVGLDQSATPAAYDPAEDF